MSKFDTTRLIGIDAAHRVPEHGSGCRNLHGHRYTIEATCSGSLAREGEQKGMTLDFKFLKEIMMEVIHDPCDHGMILRYDDEILLHLAPATAEEARHAFAGKNDHWIDTTHPGLKLYIVPFTPTAENLAQHWYTRMYDHIVKRSESRAFLSHVVVRETPNCIATYPSR